MCCFAHRPYGSAQTAFTGTYTAGSSTAFLAYLFRFPLRNLFYLIHTTATYNYTATFYVDGPTPVNAVTWKNPLKSDAEWFPVAYLSSATAGAPHGHANTGNQGNGLSYLYCGTVEDQPEARYVWMGLNDYVTFTSTGGSGSETLTANLLDTPGARRTESIPFAASHAGWLANVRVNATSLLLSSVATAFYKEGPVYAALITDESDFRAYSTAVSITTRARYHSGKNSLGVYGWLPPIGPRALERRPAITSAGTVVMSGTFPLDDGSGYEVFRIDTTTVSVGAEPALDFVMTLQTALEYATTDQWAELEYSVIDSVTALRCLQTAARCEVFADNPVHLRDIVSFVGKAASRVRRNSTVFGRALSAAFPAFQCRSLRWQPLSSRSFSLSTLTRFSCFLAFSCFQT